MQQCAKNVKIMGTEEDLNGSHENMVKICKIGAIDHVGPTWMVVHGLGSSDAFEDQLIWN